MCVHASVQAYASTHARSEVTANKYGNSSLNTLVAPKNLPTTDRGRAAIELFGYDGPFIARNLE